MFRFLAKFFGRRDRLTALSRQSDRRAFVRALFEADIFVLALLQSKGLDAASLTQEELLAEIEKELKAYNEQEHKGIHPFIYRIGDLECLPFFSTQAYAQIFCGEYSKERNRVFPFHVLGVSGSVLVRTLAGCGSLVLNARSADEYVLSEADVQLLQGAGQSNGERPGVSRT